eukprot:4421446-Prorocentrum_lima.AAC.1
MRMPAENTRKSPLKPARGSPRIPQQLEEGEGHPRAPPEAAPTASTSCQAAAEREEGVAEDAQSPTAGSDADKRTMATE